jgi:hypothetical protein
MRCLVTNVEMGICAAVSGHRSQTGWPGAPRRAIDLPVTTGALAHCWGRNTCGQLGLGTITGPELCPPNPPGIACSREPKGVVAPS